MAALCHLMRRPALSETARDRLARVVAGLLVAVIVVCVVIVIVALMKHAPPSTRPGWPTTHFTTTTTPSRPAVYYKNCAEAHADGRWNIPEGDPAYRPALDKNQDGIACESRDR